jgi:hypothetical protein
VFDDERAGGATGERQCVSRLVLGERQKKAGSAGLL